ACANPGGGVPEGSTIPGSVHRIPGHFPGRHPGYCGFPAGFGRRSEQEVMTFMTIPSTISGGPSIFQVRVGSGEVLSAGDEADVLIALYQHSYDSHITFLKKGGIVRYDSDHVELKPELLAA